MFVVIIMIITVKVIPAVKISMDAAEAVTSEFVIKRKTAELCLIAIVLPNFFI